MTPDTYGANYACSNLLLRCAFDIELLCGQFDIDKLQLRTFLFQEIFRYRRVIITLRPMYLTEPAVRIMLARVHNLHMYISYSSRFHLSSCELRGHASSRQNPVYLLKSHFARSSRSIRTTPQASSFSNKFPRYQPEAQKKETQTKLSKILLNGFQFRPYTQPSNVDYTAYGSTCRRDPDLGPGPRKVRVHGLRILQAVWMTLTQRVSTGVSHAASSCGFAFPWSSERYIQYA
jgi:hypothetical protein